MKNPPLCTCTSPTGRRRTLVRLSGIGIAVCVRSALAADKRSEIVQPATPDAKAFMARAFEMRKLAIERGDQPYGAVVVREARIVGEAASAVIVADDPTAHAEMEAIRDAARRLGTRDLSGCELYGTSRACPMCEAAAYWARIAKLRYGAAITDAGAPQLR
jgi:tRNA(Arg) A34 adenosine deaminase TadA